MKQFFEWNEKMKKKRWKNNEVERIETEALWTQQWEAQQQEIAKNKWLVRSFQSIRTMAVFKKATKIVRFFRTNSQNFMLVHYYTSSTR